MPVIPPDMRPFFSAECEDYLALLTEGFLALEADPGQEERVDRMFRAAHNLKGAARVLGCVDLAQAAHALEDVLDEIRSGRMILGATQFDSLSKAMDGFRQLLQATLANQETAHCAAELEARVHACLITQREKAPGTLPPRPSAEEGSVPRPAAVPLDSPNPPREVLKVPVASLDALVSQVGVLLVAHQRLQGHAKEAASLRDLLEEADRRKVQDPDAALRLAQRLAQALAEEAARSERSVEALETAVLQTRMVPLATVFEPVAKWVRDLASATGKSVRLVTAGSELELDKRLAEGLRDPLLHLVRNAVDHGIEKPDVRRQARKADQGLLRLSAVRERNGLLLEVEDDGGGLDYAAIRKAAELRGLPDSVLETPEELKQLLFRPGFSTRATPTEFSGRGVGLDVVATRVTELKGDLQLFSEQGAGTRVRLWVPQSLTRTRVLQILASGVLLGLPLGSIRACLRVTSGLLQTLEGRPVLLFGGKPILMTALSTLLGRSIPAQEPAFAVVLEAGGEQVALGVDELVDESEVLEKPLPRRLRDLKLFHGTTLLGDGRILLLVDPLHLANQARLVWQGALGALLETPREDRPRSLLLVDDSLTTRVQLRRILEAAGYLVQPAVDGLDAWSRLGTQVFDAVVSDVQMPGLDGCQLTMRIRSSPALARLPVVLVTTLASEEDRRRGLEAGANAYISKGSFDQEQLLASLRQLI